MSRPPLTLALSAVIAAQVEQSDRPGLLSTLHPRPPQPRPAPAGPRGLARVIPLPRVIPLLRHRRGAPEDDLFSRDLDPRLNPDLDPDFDPDFDPGSSAA
jgi:hypothetical protein